MLSIATGYSPKYLTNQVGQGVENYYTRETGRGEPPGIWQGGGTGPLDLAGQVDPADMEAVYVHFVDPRDPRFKDGPRGWRHAARLGRPPRKYRSAEDLYADAVAGEPDAEPERLEQLRRLCERKARRPVAFLDVTFGVPKSFSILHSALRAQEVAAIKAGRRRTARQWARKVDLLEKAIWAGNTAALDYLQAHAGFSRAGYHGARTPTGGSVGRWIDAHNFIVASFWQHTNRNEDMHLHIHNAILNRVECADGKWRTLDSRAIHRLRGAAGAVAERVMTERAIADLGVLVRWSEDGHTLELAGVSPLARRLFSSRRRDITEQTQLLVDRFVQRRGRSPNALELAQLSQQAWKTTRPGKKRHKEQWDVRLARWEQQLRSHVDQSLTQIAHGVPGRNPDPQPEPFVPQNVIAAAVAQVQQAKAVWTRYDLIRALNEQLPPGLGGLQARQVVRLLHELADQALAARRDGEVVCLSAPDLVAVPDELRLSDGRSVFEAPADLVYATRGHIVAEQRLAAAVRERSQAAVVHEAVDAAIAELASRGTGLGADQAAAVRGLLTSSERVCVLAAPAGTGKSFVMGLVSQLWQHHTGRQGLGLATAQRAALVLEGEGFSQTDNVDRWLQRQVRLDTGMAGPDDEEHRLQPGALVVVDEAGMTPTGQLAAIEARCHAVGARLIVVGDERQLAAVGAGGALRLMSQHATSIFTLHEVRRFAHPWERAASFRLRDGDTSVISDYERRGRILDAGTAEQAAARAGRAWLADTVAGRHAIVVVGTAEQAADLSARLRARLVELGRVAANGVPLHHESATGTIAGVGDIIQTRRNDWRLRDQAGRAVINRDMWQVTAITDTGGLRVRRIIGHGPAGRQLGPQNDLPADYVTEHVTLGYAVTVHSAQGTTVDTCYPVITRQMSADALYVAMTRGRLRSVAHVVTTSVTDGARIKPEHIKARQPGATRDTPGQVLAAIMEKAQPDLPAIELQRELLSAAGSLPVLGSRWAESLALAGEIRFRGILDRLADRRVLTKGEHVRLLRDEAAGTLWRLVQLAELAGHDPERLLREAIAQRPLDTARSVAEVLHHRVSTEHGGDLLPTGDTFASRTPPGTDPISQYAAAIAEAMDTRSTILGEQLAAQPPTWTQRLGPVPGHQPARDEWIRRAGIIASYRELYHAGDDHDPIGGCPPPGQPEARAGWFAAWRALGEPGDLAAESMMDVAELVAIVNTYQRERDWAPEWVGTYLRHTIETSRDHEQQANLLRASRVAADGQHRATQDKIAEHERLAAEHTALARDLLAVDIARAAWHAHTEPQRQAAARAVAELAGRKLDPTGTPLTGKPSTADQDRHASKKRRRRKNREAVAYPGDITQALATAGAATERIARDSAVTTPREPHHTRQTESAREA